MSNHQQQSRINEVLFRIHQDISQPLIASDLAQIAAYSEQHFHRIFKAQVGESIHQYIRRVRMEYAANLLMFDSQSSILEIAQRSGFNSASSFNKAFKATFGLPPSGWRNLGTPTTNQPYLADPDIARGYETIAQQPLPPAKIIETEDHMVAYIRHTGYNHSIRDTWMTLKAWANSEQRDSSQQFGLYHSNPAWVSLEQCRYVACIEIDTPIAKRSIVNQLVIPGGLHAVFQLSGKYGEFLPRISQIFEIWLPQSKFKLGSTPGYVRYTKNQFLTIDESFDVEFYLPISFF